MTKKHLAAATALAASAALAGCVGGSDGAPDESATPTTSEVTTTTTEKPSTTSTEPPPMTLEEWTSSGDGTTVQTWTAASWGAHTSILQSLAVGTDDGTASAIEQVEVALAQEEQNQDAVAEALATAPQPLQGLLTQSQADWENGLQQLHTAVDQYDIAAANAMTGAAASAWREADLIWEDLLPQV